jgi:hypothetical protein
MPLGACMVADAAAANGHAVRFLDLMFEKKPVERLVQELRLPTDMVGISVRNLDNNDSAQPVIFYRELAPLVRTVRQKSAARVVLGGAAVHIMAEELLRCSGADCAAIGPGETIFPALLAAPATAHVPGTAWLENGRYHHHVLDTVPATLPAAPDLSRWCNLQSYFRTFASVPLQTKRGCPFACIYCTYPMSEGTEYRLCDPVNVAADIAGYAAKGIMDIEFVDNVFNAPYAHALAVCEAIRKTVCGVRLHTVDLSPWFIDDRLLTAMEKAGFAGIGISAESAADEVLRRLKKPFTKRELIRTAQAVRRHRLPCLWVFLLGGPGETPATVTETLRFAAAVVRPRDTALFNVGVRVYPGTELYSLARNEGQAPASAPGMLEPFTYCSPAVDLGWIEETVRSASRQYANFILPGNWDIPHLDLLYRTGYRLGMRNPVWRYTGMMRKSLQLLGMNV